MCIHPSENSFWGKGREVRGGEVSVIVRAGPKQNVERTNGKKKKREREKKKLKTGDHEKRKSRSVVVMNDRVAVGCRGCGAPSSSWVSQVSEIL